MCLCLLIFGSVCLLAYLKNYMYMFKLHEIFTGGIAHSEARRHLSYAEADFEVFRPTGAIRCAEGGENLALFTEI